MMMVKKISAWKFNTFGSGGLSLGFVSVSGGEVILNDPTGKATTFYYGGGGVGISLGLKIPKLGKVKIGPLKGVSGSAGPTAFPSTGTLLITDNFAGNEFTQSDIQGVCMFVEAGGGLIAGGSGTVMLLDLNPLYIPLALVSSYGAQLLTNSAKGILLMAGANVGIQAQIGIVGYYGYLR